MEHLHPVDNGTLNAIFRYLKDGRSKKAESSKVFVSSRAPYDPLSDSESCRNALRRAGISVADFHRLRRSYATDSLRGGATFRETAELLGHADTGTVHRYAVLDDERMRLCPLSLEETAVMRRFDEYWSAHGYGRTGLTPDNLEKWCRKSDTEGAGSLEERISVIRQFARYLNGIGMSSYVAPITVKYSPPLPHLFTKDELQGLFHQIDYYNPTARGRCSKRIADEYPVLFRLIYLNGLLKI